MDSITGTKLWVPTLNNKVYDTATVLALKEDGQVSVRIDSKPGKLMLLPDDGDLPLVDEEALGNPAEYHDLVRLDPPHIANVLNLLRLRSTEQELPYTFVGPVLVSVNPLMALRRTQDGELVSGEAGEDGETPHPFRIGETVMQQLRYAKVTGQPANQAVIISGESGAGKTEAAKRVLKRLVNFAGERKKGKTSSELDKRLVDTNPILEALGNAVTLRNPNSSRFGKFMKLHLPDESPDSRIDRASVETYLLERSRVSGFVSGECNYHIFYQLLAGCEPPALELLALSEGGTPHEPEFFEYLLPKNSSGESKSTPKAMAAFNGMRSRERDHKNFRSLTKALESVGLGEAQQLGLFKVVAAVLHLGNVSFEAEDGGSTADPARVTGKTALKQAAKLLEVKSAELQKTLCEVEIAVGGEVMVSYVSVLDARKARDAIGKQLYAHMFEWVVAAINEDLGGQSKQKGGATIGVLDIFGFETFLYNDLEQLLINYTNETLHGVFLKKIFDAELSLYYVEGLVAEDDGIAVPVNRETVDLLVGVPEKRQVGVLDVIIQQAQNPSPSDKKMNEQLHKVFQGNNCFPRPHPKDVAHMFKVNHYAGIVSYHVGNFIAKNHDRLPNAVQALFASSKSATVRQMWEPKPDTLARSQSTRPRLQSTMSSSSATSSASLRRRRPNSSIVSKFKQQIQLLCDDLEQSQCSFIRCIKPNFFMERSLDSTDWFEPQYVNSQLKCLGIEPTVQVLSQGLPHRIPYRDFFQAYSSKLSSKYIKVWEKLGGGHRQFIAALFSAFGIPPSQYKLGFTKVFFKNGHLKQLEKILDTENVNMKQVGKLFKRSLVVSKWRHCIALALAGKMWLEVLEDVQRAHEHQRLVEEHLNRSIISIQSLIRGFNSRRRFKRIKAKHLKRIERELERKRRQAEEEERKKEAKKMEAIRAAKAAEEAAFLKQEQSKCKELMRTTLKEMHESQSRKEKAKEKKKKAKKLEEEMSKTEKNLHRSQSILELLQHRDSTSSEVNPASSRSSSGSSAHPEDPKSQQKRAKQLNTTATHDSQSEWSSDDGQSDGTSSHVSYRTQEASSEDSDDSQSVPSLVRGASRPNIVPRPLHTRAPSAPAWASGGVQSRPRRRQRPLSLGARGAIGSMSVQSLSEEMQRQRLALRQKQMERESLVKEASADEAASQEMDQRIHSGRERLERLSLGPAGKELLSNALEKQQEFVEVEISAQRFARQVQEAERSLREARQHQEPPRQRLSVGRRTAEEVQRLRRRRDSPYMVPERHALAPAASLPSNASLQSNTDAGSDTEDREWQLQDGGRAGGHSRGRTQFVDRLAITTPCYFTAVKRARQRGRNWRKRYFVLSKTDHVLRYYAKKHNSLQGGRGFKGELKLSGATEVAYRPAMGRRKHLLVVSQPRAKPARRGKGFRRGTKKDDGGTMFLSFDGAKEAMRVKAELELAVEYMRGEVTLVSNTAVDDPTGFVGSQAALSQAQVRKEYTKQLGMLLRRGKITEDEHDQMRSDLETPFDLSLLYMGDTPEDLANSIQVVCEACAKPNNSRFGPKCRSCDQLLPISMDLLL